MPAPLPYGGETLVNTTTTGDQKVPQVAALATTITSWSGRTPAWRRRHQPGCGRAQIFHADGTARVRVRSGRVTLAIRIRWSRRCRTAGSSPSGKASITAGTSPAAMFRRASSILTAPPPPVSSGQHHTDFWRPSLRRDARYRRRYHLDARFVGGNQTTTSSPASTTPTVTLASGPGRRHQPGDQRAPRDRTARRQVRHRLGGHRRRHRDRQVGPYPRDNLRSNFSLDRRSRNSIPSTTSRPRDHDPRQRQFRRQLDAQVQRERRRRAAVCSTATTRPSRTISPSTPAAVGVQETQSAITALPNGQYFSVWRDTGGVGASQSDGSDRTSAAPSCRATAPGQRPVHHQHHSQRRPGRTDRGPAWPTARVVVSGLISA